MKIVFTDKAECLKYLNQKYQEALRQRKHSLRNYEGDDFMSKAAEVIRNNIENKIREQIGVVEKYNAEQWEFEE